MKTTARISLKRVLFTARAPSRRWKSDATCLDITNTLDTGVGVRLVRRSRARSSAWFWTAPTVQPANESRCFRRVACCDGGASERRRPARPDVQAVHDAFLTMCAVKSKNLTRADLAVGLGIGVITLLFVGLIILKNNGARSIGLQRWMTRRLSGRKGRPFRQQSRSQYLQLRALQ